MINTHKNHIIDLCNIFKLKFQEIMISSIEFKEEAISYKHSSIRDEEQSIELNYKLEL